VDGEIHRQGIGFLSPAFSYFYNMNHVLDTLKANKEMLFSKYPLKSMALFGSYTRGDYNSASDVDVMVELTSPNARAFIELGYELEALFQKKVDIISKNGLKERYMKAIEKDLQYA
jgi:predicted nucleotidyltransferase